ncbi:MAG TPA: DUF6531 domain-containing protein, partial [Symbiobacteriaceae bacterium]|nr:DUF6531 domain-containing protein [Symbiobacteriaceae bacterium]
MDVRPNGETGYELTVSVDPQWLAATERAWPVRIDPTIYADPSHGQWKTTVSSNAATDSKKLMVSDLYASPKYVGHLQFDLSDGKPHQKAGQASQSLSSAKLVLGVPQSSTFTGPNGATFKVAQESQEWFSTRATWTQPAWQNTSWASSAMGGGGDPCTVAPCTLPKTFKLDSSPSTYLGVPENSNTTTYKWAFDVTDMVNGWLSGAVPNNGFVLYDAKSAAGGAQTITFSSPVSGPDYAPSKLELTFNDVSAPSVTLDASNLSTISAFVRTQAPLVKTELYVDGVLAGVNDSVGTNPVPWGGSTPPNPAYTAPLSLETNKFPYGLHKLTARVYTSAGQYQDSAPVDATFGDGGVTPPVNLVVTPQSPTQFKLIWARAIASNGSPITYIIERERSICSGGSCSPEIRRFSTTQTEYTDTASDRSAKYKVQAVAGQGSAVTSTPFTPVATAAAPVKPYGLRYSITAGGGIALNWAASATAMIDPGVTYKVTRTKLDGTNATGTFAVAGTSYVDAAVTANTSYSYTVTAVNAAGQESAATDALTARAVIAFTGPDAPGDVTARPDRSRQVTLNWTAAGTTGITYEVIKYTGTDPYADLVNLTPRATGLTVGSWTDDDPDNLEGVQYWYRVRASSGGKVGPWSAPVGTIATTTVRTGLDNRQAFTTSDWGSHSAAVNLSNGNFLLAAQDSYVSAPILSLAFQRTYNSLNAGRLLALGRGWTSNADWRVEPEPNSSRVFVVTGDGTEHLFTQASNGAYTPEAWYDGRLTHDTNGWSLWFPNLTTYTFDQNGRLTAVTERNGNQLLYDYPTGQLASVITAPIHKSLSFTYYPNGRLRSIVDAADRTTTYEYDATGQWLVQVTNNAGEVTRYRYDSAGRLVGLIDNAGRWNAVAYGLNGAVTHLMDGAGNATGVQIAPGVSPPFRPGNVTAPNVTAHTARISWQAVWRATAYRVYVNGVYKLQTTLLYADLSSLTSASSYTIGVAAVDANGTQGPQGSASLLTLDDPPPVWVSNVTSTGATVSWKPVTGAVAYRLRVNGGAAIETTATTYDLTGLQVGLSHTVTVAGVDNAGQELSPASAELITAYALPSPITVSATRASWPGVITSWSNGTPSSYTVSIDGTSSVPATVNWIDMTGRYSEASYTLSVKGPGGPPAFTAWSPTAAVPAPTATIALDSSCRATISWTPVAAADGYNLYWNTRRILSNYSGLSYTTAMRGKFYVTAVAGTNESAMVPVEDGCVTVSTTSEPLNASAAFSSAADLSGPQATATGVTNLPNATVTDPMGHSTSFALNGSGWMTSVTDALGKTISYQYQLTGNTLTKISVTDARGLITDYTYENSGRITKIEEHPGVSAETTDLVAPGVSTRTREFTYYPETGDLWTEATKLGDGSYHGTEYTVHLAAGSYRLSWVTAKRFVRDASGTWYPGGATPVTHTYLYDSNPDHPGWLVKVIDPNGYDTILEYGGPVGTAQEGRVTSVVRAGIDRDLLDQGAVGSNRDVQQDYIYSPDGQLQQMVDWHRSGLTGRAVTRMDYDAVGRPVRVTYADNSTRYTMYDPSGLPVLTIDQANRATVYLTDAARRTVAVVNQEQKVTSFEYDAAGRNTRVIYPAARSATDPTPVSSTITYDDVNRVTQVVDANNLTRTWEYDANGNITVMGSGPAANLYKVKASYYLGNQPRQVKEPVPATGAIRWPGGTAPATDPDDPAGVHAHLRPAHVVIVRRLPDVHVGSPGTPRFRPAEHLARD